MPEMSSPGAVAFAGAVCSYGVNNNDRFAGRRRPYRKELPWRVSKKGRSMAIDNVLQTKGGLDGEVR